MATIHKAHQKSSYFIWSCGRRFDIRKNEGSWDWLVTLHGEPVMTQKRWDSVKQISQNLPAPTYYDKMVYVANEIFEFGTTLEELEERHGLTQDMLNGKFSFDPEWEAHPAEDMFHALKNQWEYLFFSALEGDKEREATAEEDWLEATHYLNG